MEAPGRGEQLAAPDDQGFVGPEVQFAEQLQDGIDSLEGQGRLFGFQVDGDHGEEVAREGRRCKGESAVDRR
jgi:hypothetical protein